MDFNQDSSIRSVMAKDILWLSSNQPTVTYSVDIQILLGRIMAIIKMVQKFRSFTK